jgi:Zn-finger nucleic acid-binding protein
MSDAPVMDREDRPPLRCPKCTGWMEVVLFKNIVIDRCMACCGLWFDALEREQLLAIRGSEAIDQAIAAPTAGGGSPRQKLNCPVCQAAMVDMVDPRNPDLQYESCLACAGVFFDAGEFRDCKEHRIFEAFREWLDRSA